MYLLRTTCLQKPPSLPPAVFRRKIEEKVEDELEAMAQWTPCPALGVIRLHFCLVL
jgi:hypothetical protein